MIFKSLIDFGTPFESKNGTEVRATLSGFAGKDSEVYVKLVQVLW